ncbi:sugar phosphate nucleotidyltransferase [Melioribacteraceae bacterium 4301-Me]|uniref:sugar phosphate nucleotidyltransferase n=1 Tax=Pyranulibacter aquaticus TaxID=3163344 RepID=UPI00359A1162
MRAVIPAAGFGSRLKPHTYSLPKVLLNVGGKPIISHILDKLLEEKVNSATFVIGYLGEQIIDYVKKNYPTLNADFVEQKELLGLGHAIYSAKETLGNEEVFIILGDTIFDVDLHPVIERKENALGVKEVDNPERFGVAVCEKGKIVKLIEKPKEMVSKLALVGLYYIKNTPLLIECLDELIEKGIKTKDEYQLTDALQLMIDKGEKLTTFHVDGWYDCGKPETLLSTNQFLLRKNGTNRRPENVIISNPVYIAEDAEVFNSVIGPFTTIASNCQINESIIKNSIVSSGAVVERAIIENSIIGSDAVVRGNFKRINAGDSSEIEIL